MKRTYKNHPRRERNRTVARFDHDGTRYTIHERSNVLSNGEIFTRRFICRPDGGNVGNLPDLGGVREARAVLEAKAAPPCPGFVPLVSESGDYRGTYCCTCGEKEGDHA